MLRLFVETHLLVELLGLSKIWKVLASGGFEHEGFFVFLRAAGVGVGVGVGVGENMIFVFENENNNNNNNNIAHLLAHFTADSSTGGNQAVLEHQPQVVDRLWNGRCGCQAEEPPGLVEVLLLLVTTVYVYFYFYFYLD